MEPQAPLHKPAPQVSAEILADLNDVRSFFSLVEEVEVALAPLSLAERKINMAAIENAEAVYINNIVSPRMQTGPGLIRRTNGSRDLSADTQTALQEYRRQKELTNEFYKRIENLQFLEAAVFFHQIKNKHFQIEAFETLLMALISKVQNETDPQLPDYKKCLKDLIGTLPDETRSSELFRIGSDKLETALFAARSRQSLLHAKLLEEGKLVEDSFRDIYSTTYPSIQKTLNDAIELYKLLDNDSLRCAYLIRILTSAFVFPADTYPKFPETGAINLGLNEEERKAFRKAYDIKKCEYLMACNAFKDKAVLDTKNHVMEAVVKHHLDENNIKTLIYILKSVMDGEKCERGLLNIAKQLIAENRLEAFVAVLLEIPQARPLLEDQDKVKAILAHNLPAIENGIRAHLAKDQIKHVLNILKYLLDSEHSNPAALNIADQLLSEKKPEQFVVILLEFPQIKPFIKDQAGADKAIVYNAAYAVKMDNRMLADKLYLLVPDKKDEILQLAAQG